MEERTKSSGGEQSNSYKKEMPTCALEHDEYFISMRDIFNM